MFRLSVAFPDRWITESRAALRDELYREKFGGLDAELWEALVDVAIDHYVPTGASAFPPVATLNGYIEWAMQKSRDTIEVSHRLRPPTPEEVEKDREYRRLQTQHGLGLIRAEYEKLTGQVAPEPVKEMPKG
jgi:hypothetical protein